MPAAITDKFSKTFNSVNPNVARVNATRAAGVTTLACDNLAGWPTDTVVHFSTYRTGTGGAVTAGTQIDWKGIVSGNNITSLTRVAGATDAGSSINDIVEANPTASWANDLAAGLLVQHKQDGSHGAITADSLNVSGNVNIAGTLTIGGSGSGGWDAASGTISAVTYNGNRSYSLTTSNDNSALISPGMRLRTTRTVAAPTQSTSLNGTTQYYSKTTPAGMTFTDDFVVSAWVKVASYPALSVEIMSRDNGTSGWRLEMSNAGQVLLVGRNGGATNQSYVQSYQSLPLNKWVHVTAQLDMSAFTATTTTSYIMFDGVDVPVSVARGGTNPTALVQAGDLNIGALAGASFFPGKIAQAAIFSAKVTQATMRGYMSQGLTGTETSLISAYSFNNSINDLNTTNANNLTANGSATATNADSPFGGQANGTISSTLDYGIVQTVSASTIVVQVAEGCTIPTSGGVASASYSTYKSPYGFPGQRRKWHIETLKRTTESIATGISGAFVASTHSLCVPVGSWFVIHEGSYAQNNTSVGNFDFQFRLSGTTAGALSDSQTEHYQYAGAGTDVAAFQHRDTALELSAQEVYTLQSAATSGSGTTTTRILGSPVQAVIRAENAYL